MHDDVSPSMRAGTLDEETKGDHDNDARQITLAAIRDALLERGLGMWVKSRPQQARPVGRPKSCPRLCDHGHIHRRAPSAHGQLSEVTATESDVRSRA